MGIGVVSSRVRVARTLAEVLLRELPDRLAHTAGVAARAAEVAVTVDPADRELLVVAAWLHDVGYSPVVERTGFHPIDGAAYLREHGWPERICGLVAHHSGARFVAAARGLVHELDRYRFEQSAVSDALVFADQTVGPGGQPMTVEERMAEMLARRGPGSAQAQVHAQRGPYLRAAVARVELRRSPARPGGRIR